MPEEKTKTEEPEGSKKTKKPKAPPCKHQFEGSESPVSRNDVNNLRQIEVWCVKCGIHRIRRQMIGWTDWEVLPKIPLETIGIEK